MRKLFIIWIIIIMMTVVFTWSQDCGKCPSRTTCGKVKVVMVYINSTDQTNLIYHKKDCSLLQNKAKMKLPTAVKKGYKPCATCFPPEKPATINTQQH